MNLATFRAYDPSAGRWISRDPIGERGDPSGNLYGYVGQNLLVNLDPDGRCGPACGAAAGAIGGAVGGAAANLASQLLHNGGNFGCVNWSDVGRSAAIGAVIGAGVGSGLGWLGSAGEAAAIEASQTTRVGRWMSEAEFNAMSQTGRVAEGGGGRTFVTNPPNPSAYTGARPGSVYVEFDVPTNTLRPAGKPEWSVIPGPNVTTRIYGPLPAEMPPATCITCVIGGK